MPAVTHTSVEGLQAQYGTLRRAIEFYLDGKMPEEQQAALERVVDAKHIAAVAETRLFAVMAKVLLDR